MSSRPATGLAACIWRRLRAKTSGSQYLTVYGRDGLAIGEVFLFRYESLVQLPEGMDFKAISWIQTISRTPLENNPYLGPTPIPIGAMRWG